MNLAGVSEKVILRDGSALVLRSLNRNDSEALLKFYRSLPEEDRLYIGDDVTRPEFVARYIERAEEGRITSVVAESGGALVGSAALYRQKHGWTAHVAQIRMAVAKPFQRRGLGTELARCLVKVAMERGVDKLVAEVAENQAGAKKAFLKLGFQQEAILRGHVKDAQGRKHDLCILSNDVSHIWDALESLSIQYEGTMDE